MILLLGCAWVGDLEARLDYDGDGFVSVAFGGEDCADDDADIHPDADEVCGNEIDEDCDGVAEQESTWYRDGDGDGWGYAAVQACGWPGEGYLETDGDCDDTDAALTPESQWYEDLDTDGFGGELVATGCEVPEGAVDNGLDCDDGASWIHPGVEDGCDNQDSDCDGQVDEDGEPRWTDADGDTWGDPATLVYACEGATQPWDCDDNDQSVGPHADDCDKRCPSVDPVCEQVWEVEGTLTVLKAPELLGGEGVPGFLAGDWNSSVADWVGWFQLPLPALATKEDATWLAVDPNGQIGSDAMPLGDLDHDGDWDLRMSGRLVWGPLTGTWDGLYEAIASDSWPVDWNGDGVTDLAQRKGSCQVSYGGDRSLEADLFLRGEQSSDYPCSVVLPLDDVIAVEAAKENSVGRGAVYLLDPSLFPEGEESVLSAENWGLKIVGDEKHPDLSLDDAVDVDGDGHTDLLLALTGAARVVYGPFSAEGATVAASGPLLVDPYLTARPVAVGDLNGDGATELAAQRDRDGGMVVLLGDRFDGDVLLSAGWGEVSSVEGTWTKPTTAVGDVDGDGVPDLGAMGHVEVHTVGWSQPRVFIWSGAP